MLASDELSLMMQRRMSQENPTRASEAELMQRLQRLTVLAANRFMYQGSHIPLGTFLKHILFGSKS